MSKLKTYRYYLLAIALLATLFFLSRGHRTLAPQTTSENIPTTPATPTINENPDPAPTIPAPAAAEIAFVGPRGNVPDGAPKDYGFWSFAVPVPGVLSRSGQPTIQDFQWLKTNGWQSDIDLRIDGDHNEVSDDAKIPGFTELGFHYLKIPMLDGAAPTDQQAEQFLTFVTDPKNQPAHVHCRGGIGRAGIMVVLYRYAVQGWPLEKAIAESKLFQGGISAGQKTWITKWSQTHGAGSYR